MYWYGEDREVSTALLEAIDLYRGEFELHWGFDKDQPPEGLDQEEWAFAKAIDPLVRAFATATQGLSPRVAGRVGADQTIINVREAWDYLKSKGYDPLEEPVVRHRISLGIALQIAQRFDEVVNRTFELLNFLVEAPNETTRTYLVRFSECFIHGLKDETVIMAGAVLEAALDRYMPLDMATRTLGSKISYLKKNELVADQIITKASAINEARNHAVHLRPGLVPEPRAILEILIEILRELEPPSEE